MTTSLTHPGLTHPGLTHPGLTHPGSPALLLRINERKKSGIHKLALALVWFSIASSSIVFSEPAPVDILTAGLFVLLPVIGLIDARPMLVAGLAIWLPIAAFSFFATTLAFDTPAAITHDPSRSTSAALRSSWHVLSLRNPWRTRA